LLKCNTARKERSQFRDIGGRGTRNAIFANPAAQTASLSHAAAASARHTLCIETLHGRIPISRHSQAAIVRWIIFLALLLLAVFEVACNWPASEPPPSIDWVRTVDGWERPARWRLSTPKPTLLHPAVVASLELLTALLALVAFSPDGRARHRAGLDR
jgi:hypothetical protein